MALSRKALLEQVWFEANNLEPSGTTPDMCMFGATVGNILSMLNGPSHQFSSASSVASSQQKRVGEFTQGLNAIPSGSLNGVMLPRQAALLLTPVSTGKPVPPYPFLPDTFSGVFKDDAIKLGSYVLTDPATKTSAQYGLFCPADHGFSGPPAYASVLTGSGFDDPQTIAPKCLLVGKILVIASIVGFCVTACNIYATGQQLSQSYRLITGDRAGYDIALQTVYTAIAPKMLPKLSLDKPDQCVAVLKKPATGARAKPDQDVESTCLFAWQAAMQISWRGYLPHRDEEVKAAQKAIDDAAKKKAVEATSEASGANAASDTTDDSNDPAKDSARLVNPLFHVNWWNGGLMRLDAWRHIDAPMASARVSILMPTVIMILFTVLLAIACGLLVKGVPAGIFISDRNRYTLARTQVIAWSLLVLPVITAYASFNAGFGAHAMLLNPPGGVGGNDGGFVIFPSMPGEILAALGISIGSALLSPLILSGKPTTLDLSADAANQANDNVKMFKDPASALNAHKSPKDASVSDLFLGEREDDHDQMDISRLQVVVITIGLLLTYGSLLFAQAAAIDLQAIFTAMGKPRSIFDSLPQAGTTFFTLMAISHATYLVAKTPLAQGSGTGSVNKAGS